MNEHNNHTVKHIVGTFFIILSFVLVSWSVPEGFHVLFGETTITAALLICLLALLALIAIVALFILCRYIYEPDIIYPHYSRNDYVPDNNWQTVSIKNFKSLHDNCMKSNSTYYVVPGLNPWLGVLLLIIIPAGFITAACFVFPHTYGFYIIPALCMDALLVPFFRDEFVCAYTPPVGKTIKYFQNLLDKFSEEETPNVKLLPQICFDRDADGYNLPVDAKFTYALKHSVADFVSAQTVLIYNEVNNSARPYLYSVFICNRGAEALKEKIAAMLKNNKFIFEVKEDQDYMICVYRHSGYRTGEQEMNLLFSDTIRCLQDLAG